MFPSSEAPSQSNYPDELGDMNLQLAPSESIGANTKYSPSSHVGMHTKSQIQANVCGSAVMRSRPVDAACPQPAMATSSGRGLHPPQRLDL